MTRSEQINDLATALAKAQGQIEGAKKDSKNPHYNSKYADLAAVWDAIREPLSKNGLSVVQTLKLIPAGESGWLLQCDSVLMHATGQFIGDGLAIPVTRVDAQGVGSASTYARRYSLMALVGVAPEDDDANAAVGSSDPKPQPRRVEAGSATVKVTGITQRPTGKAGETKYTISADDRNNYQTFLKAHAEAAKAAQEAGQAVEVQYRQENFGRTLVSIQEVGAEAPAL